MHSVLLPTWRLPPGAMDMALGLRTMVIPDAAEDTLYRCGRALDAYGLTQGEHAWKRV